MDRYDPFDSMDRMVDQLRRSMLDVHGGRRPMSALPAGGDDPALLAGEYEMGSGGVRLEPTDEGFVAMADLPGFEREELTVTFDDGVLSIVAVHEGSEDDDTSVRRTTRRVSETVRIPGTVDHEEISGTYRNGVLEITIPTSETPDEDAHVIDIE